MQVVLQPLPNKYYSTVLEVTPPGGQPFLIEINRNAPGDDTPSVRQLAAWEYTPEEWMALREEDREDHLTNEHFERQADYDLAIKLSATIASMSHPLRECG